MQKWLTKFIVAGALATLAAGPALGQAVVSPPVVSPPVVSVRPAWQPIPGVPGMEYVPALQQDIFRYQGRCYQWYGNQWYQAPSYNGPWGVIQSPPQAFYQVGPSYWKTPPGWVKGKKKGWGGAPLPPGQMKKYQQPALPTAAPYGSVVAPAPVQAVPVVGPTEVIPAGKGKKGIPPGQLKKQYEIEDNGGGPPGKGKGKFK